MLCIECAAREQLQSQSEADTWDDPEYSGPSLSAFYYASHTTSHSSGDMGGGTGSTASDEGFTGGGGSFGGGGAGGTWGEEGLYAYREAFYSQEHPEPATFDALDAAAFDQVDTEDADLDTGAGGDFFDS